MSKCLETIVEDDITYGIIIRNNFSAPGIQFFTPQDFSQQLGYMNRKSGYEVKPHKHLLINRDIQLTQEVLFVKSGHIRVNFFNDASYLPFRSTELFAGDIILLANGGHGVDFLTDSEVVEVKQGPYMGIEDKVFIEPSLVEYQNQLHQ